MASLCFGNDFIRNANAAEIPSRAFHGSTSLAGFPTAAGSTSSQTLDDHERHFPH